MEHAPVNPSPLTDDNIRTALLQMSQAIITQAQMTTAQAQAMTAQANQEVVPILINKSLLWLPVYGTLLGYPLVLFTGLRLMKIPKNLSMMSLKYFCYGVVYK